MIEGDLGREVSFVSSGIANFTPAEGSRNLLCNRFLLAEFLQQRLVQEILDVFCIVESRAWSRVFSCLLFVARFSRVDS